MNHLVYDLAAGVRGFSPAGPKVLVLVPEPGHFLPEPVDVMLELFHFSFGCFKPGSQPFMFLEEPREEAAGQILAFFDPSVNSLASFCYEDLVHGRPPLRATKDYVGAQPRGENCPEGWTVTGAGLQGV